MTAADPTIVTRTAADRIARQAICPLDRKRIFRSDREELGLTR